MWLSWIEFPGWIYWGEQPFRPTTRISPGKAGVERVKLMTSVEKCGEVVGNHGFWGAILCFHVRFVAFRVHACTDSGFRALRNPLLFHVFPIRTVIPAWNPAISSNS